MKYTNKFDLPEPVVRALMHDDYSRGASNRSITQLIDSPRRQILEHEHDDEIEVDVSDLVWIANGKAMHKMLEGFGDSSWLPEQRLSVTINGWVISGAIDVQHLPGSDSVNLWDYKVAKAFAVMMEKSEWNNQQNCYAHLVRVNKGLEVVGLKILAIVRDWFWRDAETKRDYPPAGIAPISLPLWPAKKAEQYLVERVRVHQEAEFQRMIGAGLPECTPEERWLHPASFAVKKAGTKRAKRVLDTREEAEKWMADHAGDDKLVIEERPGEAVRCEKYCNAAPFCDQWQNELKQRQEQTDGS